MTLEISIQIFEKYLHIKFRRKPSSGSGRTDRHDDDKGQLWEFCEIA